MNKTLRIAMECHPLNLWFEEDIDGSGVRWHGRPAWQLVDLKSRLVIGQCPFLTWFFFDKKYHQHTMVLH